MSKIDKIMPYAFPLVIVGMFIMYYLVNPLNTKFPIQCPWHLLTGTQCPACGFQRALHALSHGKICEALGYNYFFILSIPYALLAILVSWYNYHHVFDRLYRLIYHHITLNVYIILYIGWWIARNIIKI